jgi:Ca2+-binding EF-hand superfamily protein
MGMRRSASVPADPEAMLAAARQKLKSGDLLRSSLSDVELTRLRAAFNAMDVNNDGRVTAMDIRTAMAKDGISINKAAA